jgi:hypothetical protein
MINMGRTRRSLIVVLVRMPRRTRWQMLKMCIEDPSEFFGMVFGGEAFADWSVSGFHFRNVLDKTKAGLGLERYHS